MLSRFVAMVVLPGVILLAFGLRALDQDRREAQQQINERTRRAAELAVAAVDQQLSNWQQFRSDGVIVEGGSPLIITPAWRLAYLPFETAPHPVDQALLSSAERYEQVVGNAAAAIPLYRHAVEVATPDVRAVALERLAACYRKLGETGLAVKTYKELLRTPGERIGSVEAGLVARFELILLGLGDHAAFYHDLVAGQWKLDKARYFYYADTARAWVGDKDAARQAEQEKLALSAAVEEYLENPRRVLSGHLAFWQGNEALIVSEALLRPRLEHFANLDQEIRVRLVDHGIGRPGAAVQALSDRSLPWVVEATPVDAVRLSAATEQRRRIYLAMLVLVFTMLMLGGYVTARTVRRELEIARLKSDIMSTVSHEFRSPLAAIQQLSELLQRGRVASEEKRQEYYELISRESRRLVRLVENLLDFSRMEEGRKQYHFDRFDPASWLGEIISTFQKAPVTLSIPPELPVIIGDRAALSSVLENLLDNAVKYSPAGAPVVCEAEAAGGELTIRVRDQGFGIAPEDRAHIFEKFYRGRGEISRQVKGAGVGLSLVRAIVEAHGGSVDFLSSVGEGTVFRVRLKTA